MFSNTPRGAREGGSGLPPAPQSMPQSSGGKRGMVSMIGPDMVITGNVSAGADLHIDARVHGDVVQFAQPAGNAA